jgi:RNA polymerase sigma factor (sigma-70 family)
MLTEAQIIDGCRKENRKAQEELYLKYAPKMRGVCYRYVGAKEDAEDIVQECFIKIFEKFSSYKMTGSLEGWIRRIVINSTLNYIKSRKKYYKQEYIDMDSESITEADYDNIETNDTGESHNDMLTAIENASFTIDELLESLNRLPLIQRSIFNLHFIDGYKHKEIAELLAINESTSRSRLMRAREIMKMELYLLSLQRMPRSEIG